MPKYINIDPYALANSICEHIFARWAAPNKIGDTNQWNVHYLFGKEGTPEQGKILFTFVTHDDVQVQVKFNVTMYVMDPAGYLGNVVTEVKDMMDQWRKDRSPIILPDRKKASQEIATLLKAPEQLQ